MSTEVMRSCRYRLEWNWRVLRMMSFLSLLWSRLSSAGSTNITGDGRPLPTTMHSPIRPWHRVRALSSIALVSHRRLVSDLIQSSSRPRETYHPGRTCWNKSPVWKCPSDCLSDRSGQSGESARMISSYSTAVVWTPSADSSIGLNRYDVPGSAFRSAWFFSCSPDKSMPPISVLPNRFYTTIHWLVRYEGKNRELLTLSLMPLFSAHCSSSCGTGMPE